MEFDVHTARNGCSYHVPVHVISEFPRKFNISLPTTYRTPGLPYMTESNNSSSVNAVNEEADKLLEKLISPAISTPSNYFSQEHIAWWRQFYRLFLSDKRVDKPFFNKINKLTNAQSVCFVELVLLIFRDITGIREGKWDPYLKGVTYFSAFNFAATVCSYIESNINDTTLDCWLPAPEGRWINQHGYFTLKFTDVEVRNDNESQGFRILAVKDSPFKPAELQVHRWACSLMFKIDLGDRRNQAAHRCRINRCCNPYHQKVASDEANKDDNGCKYGCAHYCPHKPRCIWTFNGRWLPCRNHPAKAISKHECPHNPNCFQ
jgi:hypothetical protein